MTPNSEPVFSASSTAAILALTAMQVGRGVDPQEAVERAMHAWRRRNIDVGHDYFEANEIAEFARAFCESPRE